MRILHVTAYFYPAWAYGGIPRLSFHLAQAQARMGHTVHCVTTDALGKDSRQGGRSFQVEGIDVRVYRNISNRAAYDFQFFTPWGATKEMRRVADYDVVHIHGHRNLLCSFMSHAAARASVPQVLMPNGTLVNIERRRAAKWLYDLLLGDRQVRITDAFIAVSRAEKKQMLERGIPPEKITVIPNGVYMDPDTGGLDFAKEYGLAGPYILYLGKITPRKGIEYLVRSVNLFKDKSMQLVVAGNDMGYLEEVKAVAYREGVSERVIFTGLLTGRMKAAAYKGAMYTAYVSKDEIFGLVPWESMICGTPAIVADDCGCGEWVAAARAGHVVPYGDARAVADVVNGYDAAREEQAVHRGIEYIKEHLTWERVAEKTLALYRELRV